MRVLDLLINRHSVAVTRAQRKLFEWGGDAMKIQCRLWQLFIVVKTTMRTILSYFTQI